MTLCGVSRHAVNGGEGDVALISSCKQMRARAVALTRKDLLPEVGAYISRAVFADMAGNLHTQGHGLAAGPFVQFALRVREALALSF
jgi:hypothetical protein